MRENNTPWRIWLGRRRLWAGGALVLVLVLLAGGLFVAVTADPGDCTIDQQGANDEPGQKDLTKMCVDYEFATGKEQVIWQWDEIRWTGNNTGDACSLYDVNGNSYADYALCVTVAGDPASQVTGPTAYSPRLYSCDDSNSYKCMGGTLLKDNQTLVSTCEVSQGLDPFPAGAAYPQDTVATCIVDIAEVGGNGFGAVLLDVCSFPSQQPNSDPSDCIIYSPENGYVQIKKVVVPSDDLGRFNLLVEGEAKATNVGNGGDTGLVQVSAGPWTLSEEAYGDTNLDDYTTTYSCTDGQSGSGTSVVVTVAKNQTIECTFTNTRKTYDLAVTKSAATSFDREYLWKIDKSVDDDRIEIASGASATFDYTVTATANGYTDSNWAVSGVITVTNPNYFDVVVDVTDKDASGGTCVVTDGANVTVPANSLVTRTYTCTYSAAPGPYSGTNTATAAWNKDTYKTPGGSAQGTAAYDFGSATITPTNDEITVVDDKTTGTPVELGTCKWVDGTCTFSYELSKSGTAGTCKDYTNTATIFETKQTDSQKVTVCVGVDLEVEKTAAGTFDRTYLWDISKAAKPDKINIPAGAEATAVYTVTVWQTGIQDSGWTLGGVITVTNPNDWQDITATVTDAVDVGGGANCTVSGGTNAVIPKAGYKVFSYSCSFASQPAYSGKNTATVTWNKAMYFTPTGSASGEKTFELTQEGATNKTVNVTDSVHGALGSVTATDAAPWASKSFVYSQKFTGVAGACTEYDNTATIVETKQEAKAKVTVCVGLDLKVEKDAKAELTRTWTWEIDKEYDGEYERLFGESVTHGYVVTATARSADSDWAVSGVITVTNPNAWDVDASVSDAVDVGGGAVCKVEGVAVKAVTVPKNGSMTLSYACTFSSKPAYEGKNTATATWDKDKYFSPNGMASGEAGFKFDIDEVNPVVKVTDTNGYEWTADRQTSVWAYSETFTCSEDPKDYTKGSYTATYTNIATIVQTGQTDTATVKLTCLYPSIDLDKQIRAYEDGMWQDSLEVIVGTPLYYRFVVKNDGGVDLTNVVVTDPTLGETCNVGDLAVGGEYICGPYGPFAAAYNDNKELCNTATAVGHYMDYSTTATDKACYTGLYWAFTPGFWKNHAYDSSSGKDAWLFTAYGSETGDYANVCDVFVDAGDFVRCENLLDTLRKMRGGNGDEGAAQILLRAGIAALLNASFHEVQHGGLTGPQGEILYPWGSAQVIQEVNDALSEGREVMLALATMLDGWNNGIHHINWDDPAEYPTP